MQGKCTTNIEVNKVGIEFTGKEMTSYGGFSLLAMFFEKIRLKEALTKIIPVTELSPNSKGIYSKCLAYALVVYAGGNRFSHLVYLGFHATLSKLFGVDNLPSASTTLTRLFGKIKTMKAVEEMSLGLWMFLEGLIPWAKIIEDWLTFDSTVLERYGKQEGVKRGYNPKKKGRGSHHPLLAFLNKSKYVVHLWNRPGNATSHNNIIGFFESAYERIRRHIKVSGIITDSGFYIEEFIKLLEEKGLIYIIAVRLYQPLQRKIYGQKEWKVVDEGIWITEFTYCHDKWEKERRYIAIRQDIKRREKAMGKTLPLFKGDFNVEGFRYSVWITNSTAAPKEVWDKCRPRANDENTLKELKEDFALGGFSMKNFYSTEAAMLIRVFIYNLFVLFRHEVFDKKEKTERLTTLRYKYFVLPAQMGKTGRSLVLRISVIEQKVRMKLIHLFNRIEQGFIATYLNCNAFG